MSNDLRESIFKSLVDNKVQIRSPYLPENYFTRFRDDHESLLVKEGDYIRWKIVAGSVYEGTIIEMDANVAIVKCNDGVIRNVEC